MCRLPSRDPVGPVAFQTRLDPSPGPLSNHKVVTGAFHVQFGHHRFLGAPGGIFHRCGGGEGLVRSNSGDTDRNSKDRISPRGFFDGWRRTGDRSADCVGRRLYSGKPNRSHWPAQNSRHKTGRKTARYTGGSTPYRGCLAGIMRRTWNGVSQNTPST